MLNYSYTNKIAAKIATLKAVASRIKYGHLRHNSVYFFMEAIASCVTQITSVCYSTWQEEMAIKRWNDMHSLLALLQETAFLALSHTLKSFT